MPPKKPSKAVNAKKSLLAQQNKAALSEKKHATKHSKSITRKPLLTYHSIETTLENGMGQTRQVHIQDNKGSEVVTTLPDGKSVKKPLKKNELEKLKQRNLDEFFPKMLKL